VTHRAWHAVQQMRQADPFPTGPSAQATTAAVPRRIIDAGNSRPAVFRLLQCKAVGQTAAPVQFKPTIVIDKIEHPDPTLRQIEDFLEAHGQRIAIMFPTVLEDIDGTFSGLDGAAKLNKAIDQKQSKITGVTGTEQKSIMNKLGAIAYLIATTRGDLERQKTEAIRICTHLQADQGLCYGFTEIFKRHARWESALWKAIASWVPQAGSPKEMLDALNKHLDETIRWASGRREDRADEALLLLKEAWQYMQIDNRSYFDLPEWMDAVKGAASKTKLEKVGQITRIVEVPRVEPLDVLTREFKDEVEKTAKERKDSLGVELASEISEKQGVLKKLEGLFDLKEQSKGEDLIRSQGADPGIEKELIRYYQDLFADTRKIAQVKARTFGLMGRSLIKTQIVNAAFESRFGSLQEDGPQALAMKKRAAQELDYENALRMFSVWLSRAGTLIDSACEISTSGEVLVEISTGGHSMSARCTKGRILFLEPQYLGVGTFESWAGLSGALWKGLQVGSIPGDLEKGIALDMELSDVKPAEAEDIGKEERLNLLSKLEAESIEAFSAFASGDDPAKFLQKHNPALFKKIRFTDQ